jgi:hypothetical protein
MKYQVLSTHWICFNSNRVWNSWFNVITGLALSFPVSDFFRPTGCRSSLFDLTPVIHRGQDWPDWLDQGFPVSPGTAYPPNHVNARADDQNVCKGCFVRLRWLPGVLGDHPPPHGLAETGDSVSFDGLGVENCRWTACPLGEWTVRSNNTRTVVSKLLDWMFGIIPSSRKLCPSWLDFGPNTSIDSFFQSFTEHVTLHTWWLTCGVLVFTEHTTFWITPHEKTLNRSLNRGVQRCWDWIIGGYAARSSSSTVLE